eukprot:g5581.t1
MITLFLSFLFILQFYFIGGTDLLFTTLSQLRLNANYDEAFKSLGIDYEMMIESIDDTKLFHRILDEVGVQNVHHRTLIESVFLRYRGKDLDAIFKERNLDKNYDQPPHILPRQNMKYFENLCHQVKRVPNLKTFTVFKEPNSTESFIATEALNKFGSILVQEYVSEARSKEMMGIQNPDYISELRSILHNVKKCKRVVQNFARRTKVDDNIVTILLTFSVGLPFSEKKLRQLLGNDVIASFTSPKVSLLRCKNQQCQATTVLYPTLQQTYAFTDDGAPYNHFDPVMYLGNDSLGLLHLVPRDQPKVERHIDFCCGSGIQAISALQHYADHAVLVDINERAVLFSHANLRLNNIDTKRFDVRLGDGWSVVKGNEQFDTLTVNPPYLPNDPDAPINAFSQLYGNGGPLGWTVTRKIYRGMTKHMKECGRMYHVGNLMNPKMYPQYIRNWLSEGNNSNKERPVSVHLIHGKIFSPKEYVKNNERMAEYLRKSGVKEATMEGYLFSQFEDGERNLNLKNSSSLDSIWNPHMHPWQWIQEYVLRAPVDIANRLATWKRASNDVKRRFKKCKRKVGLLNKDEF